MKCRGICSVGSHVDSAVGYPNHLTRYSYRDGPVCTPSGRLSRKYSTTNGRSYVSTGWLAGEVSPSGMVGRDGCGAAFVGRAGATGSGLPEVAVGGVGEGALPPFSFAAGLAACGTGTVLSREITSVFPLGCLIVTVVSVSFVTGNGPSATGASLCARSSLSWYSFRTKTAPPTSGLARMRRRRASKFFL